MEAIVYGVDDPIIGDPDSPSILGSDKFSAAIWSWIIGQRFEDAYDSASNFSR